MRIISVVLIFFRMGETSGGVIIGEGGFLNGGSGEERITAGFGFGREWLVGEGGKSSLSLSLIQKLSDFLRFCGRFCGSMASSDPEELSSILSLSFRGKEGEGEGGVGEREEGESGRQWYVGWNWEKGWGEGERGGEERRGELGGGEGE